MQAVRDPGTTVLHVAGLSKSFGDKEIFSGIDLDVVRGEVVGLIGPSGTGKSTFLRCLNLLETPDAGSIVFDGRPLFSDTVSLRIRDLISVRRQLGMVFQHFNLFPNMTAADNVTLAQIHGIGRSKNDADRRSRELLDRVGLTDVANRRPDQLSGGQQQRVAIARALALDPQVLLLDEPTSAIDPELRIEVRSVVSELAESGVTMIIVTHELDFVRKVADRVLFMAEGQVVEQGPAHDILTNPSNARTRQFIDAVNG